MDTFIRLTVVQRLGKFYFQTEGEVLIDVLGAYYNFDRATAVIIRGKEIWDKGQIGPSVKDRDKIGKVFFGFRRIGTGEMTEIAASQLRIDDRLVLRLPGANDDFGVPEAVDNFFIKKYQTKTGKKPPRTLIIEFRPEGTEAVKR